MKGIFTWAMLCITASLLWSGPLALCRSAAARRGRAVPGWLAAALVLSPLGWVSAVSLLYARGWMIPASIAAPLFLALLLRVLPPGSDEKGTCGSRLLPAAILAYGLWSAVSAGRYLSYTMMASSNDKASIGSLGGIRSALSIYQGDHDGAYPAELSALTPKYLDKLPELHAIARGRILHLPSRKVTYFQSRQSDDRGGWGYVDGVVFINCTHPDLRTFRPMSEH